MCSGQVAAGVRVETLRYSERQGVLRAPARRRSGYRDYGADAVGVVRFIKRTHALGFRLAEVESLFRLAAGGPDGGDAVQVLAHDRLANLDRRLAELRVLRAALRRQVATCARARPQRVCPLLAPLAAPAGDAGRAPAGRRPVLRWTPVRIELLRVPGCANAERARRTLRRCLTELGIRAPVEERVGDFPSPSILVDGRDVMGRTALTGAACRLDVPTRERVLAALRAGRRTADGPAR